MADSQILVYGGILIVVESEDNKKESEKEEDPTGTIFGSKKEFKEQAEWYNESITIPYDDEFISFCGII